MYTKKLQIINYGPISHLDIALPFEEDRPKPVLLVGENGSGKSILLSHIVNGLASAQGIAYPETPAIEVGKAFKLWSTSYVRSGSEWSYSRVDFERNLFIGDVTTSRNKEEGGDRTPEFPSTEIERAWRQIEQGGIYRPLTNIDANSTTEIKDLFTSNCVLYFPHNRFEEPAWLNQANLRAQASYMHLDSLLGHTNRRLINYAALQANQDWLFDVVYDMTAFEEQLDNLPILDQKTKRTRLVREWKGFHGASTNLYQIAMDVVGRITRHSNNATIGFGRRKNRNISLMKDGQTLVNNIFQLSSASTTAAARLP